MYSLISMLRVVIIALAAFFWSACISGTDAQESAAPLTNGTDTEVESSSPATSTPNEQPDSPASEPSPDPTPTPSTPTTPVPSPTAEPDEPELLAPTGGTTADITAVALAFTSDYDEPPVKLPTAYNGAGIKLPIQLENVTYLDKYELADSQLKMLSESGFVVIPSKYYEFFSIYQYTNDRELPVYVTTDSMLHIYHLLFDKLLRDLEDERFSQTASNLTDSMVHVAQDQYETAKGTTLEDTLLRVWAYFSIAQQLLTPEAAVATPVKELVEAELQLIDAHQGLSASPLLSINEPYIEDYSQYMPRGHYSRTEARKRYFRAMMWYGRMSFRLKVREETRIALMITWLSHAAQYAGDPAAALWAEIYDPTAFLVGTADDLGIREYSQVLSEVYGDAVSFDQLADETKLDEFIQAARNLPPPQINSLFVWDSEDTEAVTQGFRFMGQRFVLDGYIFTQLLHDKVSNRFLPNALDVLAAMGNKEAYGILAEIGETSYQNYDNQLDKLQVEVSGLSQENWVQNVYFCWLYTLEGVITEKDQRYPPYMRTNTWAQKDLHSALGSWAELKHDTILYAKQPMACGAAPPGEGVPRHQVEPNPLVFARLQGLTRLTHNGLSVRELLSEDMDRLLNQLDEKLTLCQSVAEQELADTPPTPDQIEKLGFYGDWLKWMVQESADQMPGENYMEVENEPAAIIADVATDPMSGQALEVGTGYIFEIYVVTPNSEGLQVARGGVYSYYEFPWPISDRLTDEKWREMLFEGSAPPRPAWTESFVK